MLDNLAPPTTKDSKPPDQEKVGWIWRWLWEVLWVSILLLCPPLIATAFLPLLPVDWWWVRIWDFPRVQLLFSYLLILSVILPFLRKTAARILFGLLLICVAIQIFWIFPYLPVAPYEVRPATIKDPTTRLRIMSANVLQENENAAPLLKLIREKQPDVVLLCEVNDRWISDLKPLEVAFKHQVLHPLDNTHGLALYTNLELESARVRHLVRENIPSIDAHLRLPNDHSFRLFAVHPNPPRFGQGTSNRDAELILVGREVREDRSAVVLGDMNDVGWSRTTNLFQEVSRLLDPRQGRGLFATYNAHSWLIRYPLDYLFHSDDFCVVSLETLPDIGSDHFPLLVELSYEPSVQDQQQAPGFDSGDKADAAHAVQSAPGDKIGP